MFTSIKLPSLQRSVKKMIGKFSNLKPNCLTSKSNKNGCESDRRISEMGFTKLLTTVFRSFFKYRGLKTLGQPNLNNGRKKYRKF